MVTLMSAEQIVEYCWWYLDHLYLILIPAAIFDIVCWTAIAIYLKRKRATPKSHPGPGIAGLPAGSPLLRQSPAVLPQEAPVSRRP